MTAPALQIASPPPRLPDGWLSLSDAAHLLGVSVGHLRRQCSDALAAAGQARKFDDQWAVHRSADARLSGAVSREQRDLRQLAGLRLQGASERQLAVAELKRDLLVGLDSFRAPGNEQQVRAAYVRHLYDAGLVPADGVPRCSVRTLYRWQRDYQTGGLAALVRASGVGATTETGAAAWDYFKNLILAGNNIRVATAWTLTRGEAGRHPDDPAWSWPALRTIQLRAQREIPLAARVYANKGLRAFSAACLPKGRRDFESIPANDEWCGDERTLDVMCRVDAARGPRRCRELKFTCWIDMRSRKIVGWVLDVRADSNTILAALKRGIQAEGKPRALRVDWGRDYRKAMGHAHHRRWSVESWDGPRVAGVLDRLGIEVNPVTPYTPWAKPIESMFRGLKEHFDKLLASFWGGGPAERHEDRDRWCQANLERLPTVTEIRTLLSQYIDAYNAAPHGGDGMFGKSPNEAMAAFRDGPARMESQQVLEFLFCEFTGEKVVRRDGVRHLNGWYGFGDARLVAMLGQRVLLAIQPDDLTYAWVCDPQRRPLFRAECQDNRFRTKEDARRLAQMRARIRRPYAQQARAGREFLLAAQPADLIGNQLANPPTRPAADLSADLVCRELLADGSLTAPLRLVTARPDLESDLAAATPAPSECKPHSNAPEIGVELSDLDPEISPATPIRAIPADDEDPFSAEDFLRD